MYHILDAVGTIEIETGPSKGAVLALKPFASDYWLGWSVPLNTVHVLTLRLKIYSCARATH